MNHSFEDLHKLSKLRGNMQDLYSNLLLRTFAYSIISVFVPIYLFHVGMSFEYVFLFFAALFFAVAIFTPIAIVVAERIGLKNTLVVSLPFSILFFLMIYKMGCGEFYPMYIIAIVGGIGEAFYFSALNVDFALNSKTDHRGYNIAGLDSFFKSSALFGPVFGAWVIVSYGFELVLGFVMLLLMLSVIPALQVNVYRDSFVFSFKRVFLWENVRYLFAFFSYGVVSAAEWFLWPVFVFFVLHDVMLVALAVALVGLGTALFAGLFQRVSSSYSVSAFLKVGAIVYALSWVLRANSFNALDIYTLSFLAGLVIVIVNIPFFTDTIERAKEKGVVEFIVFREIAVCLGRVAFFGAMLLALGLGIDALIFGFAVAAIASVGFMVV